MRILKGANFNGVKYFCPKTKKVILMAWDFLIPKEDNFYETLQEMKFFFLW